MKKVKMMVTEKGCSDDIKVEEFEKGKTYTISDSLAKVFVGELKVAKYAKEKKENRIIKAKVETPEDNLERYGIESPKEG